MKGPHSYTAEDVKVEIQMSRRYCASSTNLEIARKSRCAYGWKPADLRSDAFMNGRIDLHSSRGDR